MDKSIAKIVKALALTENGGKVDVKNPVAGKTGEMKSIFQFTPDTWKNYAQQASGDKDLPMTPENEALVTYHKVGDWLGKGYNPKQIASMWNAGIGEPNAYSGKFSDGSPSRGINKKYGVKYDVPEYVNKFEKYLSEDGGSSQQSATPDPATANIPTIAENMPTKSRGLLPNTPLVNQGMLEPKP